MNETKDTAEYTEAPVKEIPYSHSRVYVPRVHELTNEKGNKVLLHTLPSGTRYVRMADGSLRRARIEFEQPQEAAI